MDDEKKGRVGDGGRVASQERPWQAGNRFWYHVMGPFFVVSSHGKFSLSGRRGGERPQSERQERKRNRKHSQGKEGRIQR